MNPFIERYEQLVATPELAKLFRDSGFFNVGLWSPGTGSAIDAARALTDRVVGELPAAGRVLEIACGAGGPTRRAHELRPQLEWLACDLSLPRLVQASRRAPGARFFCAEADRLPFASRHFDAVVAIEAAFHFPSRAAFLTEARRVLRPGGVLVLTDLVLSSAAAVGPWMVPEVNLVADRERYAAVFPAAGFEAPQIVDWTEVCWRSFLRFLAARDERREEAGELDAAGRDAARDRHQALATEGVVGYFLVSARCPAAS
ncbi:MAG: class I SAM-dependent methyltransferase [Thermoanaerobaculia bacterium]